MRAHKPLSGLGAKETCSSQLIGVFHTEGLRAHWVSVKNTVPSQSAWVGIQILVFLKIPGGPSDLPRLTDCRRLDSFQGWFRSWPSARRQGQADMEGLKRDLGLNPVPPVPFTAHFTPLGPPKETPGS